MSALVTIAAPLAMIVLWGRFAAPRSSRRLGKTARIPFELAVFAALVVLNAVLLTRLGQWDQ